MKILKIQAKFKKQWKNQEKQLGNIVRRQRKVKTNW
jgi:hypothetical protein